MDQDIEIINTNTRNEKIKNFFIKNKKLLISLIIVIILILFSFFFYQEYKSGQKEKLANQYKKKKVPLIIIAGREYGTGSSRDWAAKGTKLLGVKAVIAESFERNYFN